MSQFRYCVLLCMFLVIFGCGGSGSGSGTNLPTGVFSDAPVQGIHYRFGSYSGLTGPGGTFCYQPGSTGTFRVGDIVVGSAPGKAVLTPIDLIAARHPSYNQAQNRAEALKVVQFLTSIGGGAGQSELIITPQVNQAATGAFGGVDLATANLSSLVNSLGSFSLTSAVDAESHLNASLANANLARHAGEYLVVDSGDVASAYLIIKPQGEVFASIVDFSGNIHQAGGTVTSDGVITFIPTDLSGTTSGTVSTGGGTRNTGGLFLEGSGSGTSDGKGNVSLRVSFPNGRDYVLGLARGANATARFFGNYSGSNWMFLVDGRGNMSGLVSITGGRNSIPTIRVTGSIDPSTGRFELLGSSVRFAGTITGSAVTGTLTQSVIGETTVVFTGERQTTF